MTRCTAGAATTLWSAAVARTYWRAGADQFLFKTVLNAYNNHSIADFTVGEDRLGLDQTIFTAFAAAGTLDAAAFAPGTAAPDSNTHIVYDSVSGNIWYDPDGNGSAAQMLFAHDARHRPHQRRLPRRQLRRAPRD